MGRKSKDEEAIDFICERNGFDPKVVYELTKMMLEQYSRSVAAGKVISDVKSEADQLAIKRQMRKAFLEIMKLPIEESREEQKKILWQISEYEWLSDLKDYVLKSMEEYGDYGRSYRTILECCYMRRKKMTMVEVAAEVKLAVPTLSNKKREAIKLFGIYCYLRAALKEQEDNDNNDNNSGIAMVV